MDRRDLIASERMRHRNRKRVAARGWDDGMIVWHRRGAQVALKRIITHTERNRRRQPVSRCLPAVFYHDLGGDGPCGPAPYQVSLIGKNICSQLAVTVVNRAFPLPAVLNAIESRSKSAPAVWPSRGAHHKTGAKLGVVI